MGELRVCCMVVAFHEGIHHTCIYPSCLQLKSSWAAQTVPQTQYNSTVCYWLLYYYNSSPVLLYKVVQQSSTAVKRLDKKNGQTLLACAAVTSLAHYSTGCRLVHGEKKQLQGRKNAIVYVTPTAHQWLVYSQHSSTPPQIFTHTKPMDKSSHDERAKTGVWRWYADVFRTTK